jgi:hypothetical protein
VILQQIIPWILQQMELILQMHRITQKLKIYINLIAL